MNGIDKVHSAIVAYISAKAIVYTLWCGYGISKLAPNSPLPLANTIVLGVLRTLIGFVFGVVVAIPLMIFPLGYAVILIPTRWVEWSIIQRPTATASVLSAKSKADNHWRIIGIALSCALDLILVLSLGTVGLGHILC